MAGVEKDAGLTGVPLEVVGVLMPKASVVLEHDEVACRNVLGEAVDLHASRGAAPLQVTYDLLIEIICHPQMCVLEKQLYEELLRE